MITMRMIEDAYDKGIIQLIISPHDDGIVCQIGENWFYFGGHCAEEYDSAEKYKQDIPKDDIIADIYITLADLHNELRNEYDYYVAILAENGIRKEDYVSYNPAIFGKAKALEHRACEFLPGNSHDYEFYLGKARGIIEGAAIALGVSYDELNNAYNKWWKEQK